MDVDDFDQWLSVMPHKSREVVRDYRRVHRLRPRGYREQYLNVWPPLGSGAVEVWPPRWGDAPRVGSVVPPAGGVGAFEGSFDRRWFSVSVAVRVGDGVELWSRRLGSQDEAVALLLSWEPERVLVGASLFAHLSLPIVSEAAGVKETHLSTAMFAELVRRGLVAHDFDVDLAAQVGTARVAEHESGLTLSSKASKGPTDLLKTALWVTAGVFRPGVEEAAIW